MGLTGGSPRSAGPSSSSGLANSTRWSVTLLPWTSKLDLLALAPCSFDRGRGTAPNFERNNLHGGIFLITGQAAAGKEVAALLHHQVDVSVVRSVKDSHSCAFQEVGPALATATLAVMRQLRELAEKCGEDLAEAANYRGNVEAGDIGIPLLHVR